MQALTLNTVRVLGPPAYNLPGFWKLVTLELAEAFVLDRIMIWLSWCY